MAGNIKDKKIAYTVRLGHFNPPLYVYTNWDIADSDTDGEFSTKPGGSWTIEQLAESKEFPEATISLLREIESVPGVRYLSISNNQISIYKYIPENWDDMRTKIVDLIAEKFSVEKVVDMGLSVDKS